MFYSHDLLGRKTPLGAIWTLAHGRKLSKGKIISINLREICDEILQPGVPHSLRLQGILIGGLVLVFSKQQTYLLEDLQEMMRRVKAAGKATGSVDAAKTEATGKGRTKGKGGKQANQARLEAITMMDYEDLLAPAAFDDDDILGLLAGGGSLSDVLASQGAVPWGPRAGGDLQEGRAELADDLFIMPSLGGPTTSEAADTTTEAEGREASRHTSETGGSSRQRQQQQQPPYEKEQEVYGGLELGEMQQQDWLHPEDEMFDIHADLDLLGGMDLPAHTHQHHQQQQHEEGVDSHLQHPSTTTTSHGGSKISSAAAGGSLTPGAMAAGVAGDEYMMEMDLDLMQHEPQMPTTSSVHDSQQQQQQQQQEEDHEEEEEVYQADRQQGRDQGKGGARAAAARKLRSKKRKAGGVVVDDLDNLVIRSKVYRDWSTDSSPLLRSDGAATSLFISKTSAAAPIMDTSALPEAAAFYSSSGFGAGPLSNFGAGGLSGGVPLCPELLSLFKAPVEAATAAAGAAHLGGKQGRQQQPGSPEVNNSTGDGSLPGAVLHHASVHRRPLPLQPVPGVSEEVLQGGDEMLVMMDESPPPDGQHPDHDQMDQMGHMDKMDQMDQLDQDHDLRSNDEAHDQLGDLPFNGDLEVERMRAAPTPGSSDGSLQHMLASAGALAPKMTAGKPAGADSGATSAGGSSLMGHRVRRSELDSVGLKRRLGSADLGTTEDLDIFFGTGNLADLLPDINMDETQELQQHPEEEEDDEAEATAGAGAARGGGSGLRAGSVPSSGGLTPYASSQFPLLEETEPDQTQPQRDDAISSTTRVALSIFQQRLKRSADAQADKAGSSDAAAAAEPHVSLFGLIKEGRLSRNQAANLFYQVCVTSTAGYVSASQDRPFGDITIKQGTRAIVA